MRKRQKDTKRSKPKHKRHEIKQQINKRETIQKIKHKNMNTTETTSDFLKLV